VLAEKLYRAGDAQRGLAACAACHGPAGRGMPIQYPLIAGQFADYTIDQLKQFRGNLRKNDPEGMMRAVAKHLTDDEITALADYLAGLRLSSPN
jgi:cytochrome c553